MLSKFEKRLSIFAIIFVAVYLLAAGFTIHSRIQKTDRIERFESKELTEAESQLVLAELFLPMIIVLTLAVSFVFVRRRRAKDMLKLDEEDEQEGPLEP